jgi:ATP synthase protein I
MESPKNPSQKKQEPDRQINQYIRYSGLGFQMLAAVLIGVWLGVKTDHWLGMKYPVFTIIFIILSIISSLLILIRSLPKS